jgi:N6-L-threonylcarbamoyladenine synthase
MKILGIETSCDETAAAVVKDGVKVLSNKIASQVEIHARYGGIVPEVASRQHMLAIIPIIDQAMGEAGVSWGDLDAVAVTMGPGLAGSLLIGVNAAKSISMVRKLPLVGVNHLEGHIYANWLTGADIRFPVLCLIVSGGHSDMVWMKGHGDYDFIGGTRDDAAGEAFDKVARVLGLGYPGGPAVQNAAEKGRKIVKLPYPWLEGTNDFSFSGIKTALIRLVENGRISLDERNAEGLPDKNDAAASFQEAVVKVLAAKAINLAKAKGANQILVAGGVAANKALRERLIQDSPVPVLIPPVIHCTDNAAMIASCGYFKLRAGAAAGLDMDAVPALKMTE